MIPRIPYEHLPEGPALGPALHPDLGHLVLAKLREYCPLPSQGLVAGQAVLSVLLEIHGVDGSKPDARRGPFNDVDVFSLETKRPEVVSAGEAPVPVQMQMQMNQLVKEVAAEQKTSSAWPQEASGDYLMGRTRGYLIGTVAREGLLNTITYAPVGKAPEEFGPQDLLAGFDLNMVSVGVDLFTGRLHWGEGFERFWNGGAVELQDAPAPQVALPRLLKKASEMPWLNIDVPHLARDCLVIMSAHKNKATIGIGFVSRPPKYVEMLRQYDPEEKCPLSRPWTRGQLLPEGVQVSEFSAKQQMLLRMIQASIEQHSGLGGGGVAHPIATAAALDLPDLIQEMASMGLDINDRLTSSQSISFTQSEKARGAMDRACKSPLDMAVFGQSPASFYELLRLGASDGPVFPDLYRDLVEMHRMMKRCESSSPAAPLILAAHLVRMAGHGLVERIDELHQAGADAGRANGDGLTPLMAAAMAGHTRAAVRLIELGADCEAKGPDGLTAVDLADSHNHKRVAIALRAAAAKHEALKAIADIERDLRSLAALR